MTRMTRNKHGRIPEAERNAMVRELPIVGNAWDRQFRWNETPKAYECFQDYLHLDPTERTIKEASRVYKTRHGLSLKSLESNAQRDSVYLWSTRYRWQERASLYDSYMASKEIAKIKKRRVMAMSRHADNQAKVQEALMHPVNLYASRLLEILDGKRVDELKELSDEDLLRLGRHTASILADAQKSELEALSTSAEVEVDAPKLIARGRILRRVLEDKTKVGMLEDVSFEIAEEEARSQETG